MEMWRKVWHEGLAPSISNEGLEALKVALASDDERLLQGATTVPPPFVQDWPVEAACALGFCGWTEIEKSLNEDEFVTVAEVESYFARLCFVCDQIIGEPAACRYFLNWWDESPRDEVLRELGREVEKELERRGNVAVTAGRGG